MAEATLDPARWAGKRVLVTGGAGFIGSYVAGVLAGECGVPPGQVRVPRSRDCDLRVFDNCLRAVEGCDLVVHLAAVTGGIGFSRQNPASQYYDSTLIDLNMIEAARRGGASKVVALGNLFAYSGDAEMPLREERLFDGLPTDAHRGVGWMKRNLALVSDLYWRQHRFPVVVLYAANAYGPRDSVDPKHAHVMPATIMKCFRQDALEVWGDGSPTRDFLFVEDLARYILLACERIQEGAYMNVGSGSEISVRDLVGLIVKHVGFRGPVTFDATKGGGDARRCASTERADKALGTLSRVTMDDGIGRTVAWYREQRAAGQF